MPNLIRPLVAALAFLLAGSSYAAKPAKPGKPESKPEPVATEFELAHNLGELGERNLREVVERFNKESKTGSVRLVRLEKGAKAAPLNLIRRYDIDEVLASPSRYMPLYKMMASAKEPLREKDISADLRAGSFDDKGHLVSLPVAYSTPVLFYNKNAMRKAKLDPEKPPRTWMEMQQVLDKLQDAGYQCPYTSSWPVWVHIDNVGAVSGAPVANEKGVLAFNGFAQVKHIAMMMTWTKAGFFRHFGRRAEANERFQNGECAMITTDSWEHTEFREAKGVELGVAPLPYHDDLYGGRKNTLAGGASLWVGAGRSPAEYKMAAKFVSYLMAPETQIALVKAYGQLPISDSVRSRLSGQVPADTEQVLQVAYASLRGDGAKPPLRVADIDPVRIIINEEMDQAWADGKPAKAALDTAASRGNAVLSAKPLLKKVQPF